jgi:superoxide dismutase, Fe-Mn family
MHLLNRRQLLKAVGAGAAALAVPSLGTAAQQKGGKFELPPLPYAYDALEPHIDAETMKIHHDLHHKAYVDNLNKAIAKHPSLAGKSLEALLRDIKSVPQDVRGMVRNHGGGHYNHTLFWEVMAKEGGKPSGELAKAIDAAFGNYEKFQQYLTTAATGQFGSGWGWLVVEQGKLAVRNLPNQDSPLMNGATPILGIDVWEHAYYLKYKNRRPEYVKAWWNVINWANVSEKYNAAVKQG